MRHVYIRATIDVTTDNPAELIEALADAVAFYKSNGVPDGVDRIAIRSKGVTVGTFTIHNNRKD